MTEDDLLRLLDQLRALPNESEWVEFKEAKTSFDSNTLGKYVSALANEANLKQQGCAWLVFGVRDKDRAVIGTRFRQNPTDLAHLKHEVAEQTTSGLTFVDIFVVQHPDGRVVMFQIPSAPQGMPIAWKGHWYGRDGESLVPLALHELDAIRAQAREQDWSAETCPSARFTDLDPAAIAAARANFRAKNQDKAFAGEIDTWSDATFLDRSKLTVDGKITRAALLLLGRGEAAHHLQPAVAQITWRLEGEERAYEHFGPPFLLSVNDVYARIRNTNQKFDVPRQLVPLEFPKYEKWVVLEALHNAIAHQDYTRQARIIVTETLDRLSFESAGGFFEGSLADYTLGQRTPLRYRNRFLANAMVNVNMIDTMGYGIQRMFVQERNRYHPLPDFDLTDPDKVVVTIHGKVIDPNYTALLMEHHDLPLKTVILLDSVQKRRPIARERAASLRRQGLVEGRFPNLFVSADVASAVGDRAQYIRNRAFDDRHYKGLVASYLERYHGATRTELEGLLADKLSDVLSDAQKRNKVRNLLQSMAAAGTIRNDGSRRYPRWVLCSEKKSNGQ